jgi:hypothetical protein
MAAYASDVGTGPADAGRSFVARLVGAGSELGRQLARVADQPLRAYLAGLVRVPAAAPPSTRAHREHLLRAVAAFLEARAEPDVASVCEELGRAPVIQQADHSNLLLDPETFLNNYLFHVAARDAGARTIVVSQCSTVSCIARRQPLAGPVFLATRGGRYKVFALSNRRLKHSAFCCLPAPLEFAFEPLDRETPPAARDPLLARFLGRRTDDAPEAFRRCNDELWRALALDREVRRVAVDERMASLCLARHLRDRTSPVRRLLFDADVRDAFCRVKRELVAEPANLAVNRAEPDFLWWRDGTRLRPVVVGRGERAELLLEGGASLPLAWRPAEVARALEDGAAYGDRVLAYAVRCLLPGVVAIGGTSQQDYVALYRRMLLETDRVVPFLDAADIATLQRDDLSRLGGMPLLELDDPARELIATLGPETRLHELDERFLDRPVGETIGDLRCARYFEHSLDAQVAP